MFDFTDYPKDTKFFDSVNKKVISKMKDEFKTKIISEFVGLKLKVYSLIDVDNEKKSPNELIKKMLKTQDINNILIFL